MYRPLPSRQDDNDFVWRIVNAMKDALSCAWNYSRNVSINLGQDILTIPSYGSAFRESS